MTGARRGQGRRIRAGATATATLRRLKLVPEVARSDHDPSNHGLPAIMVLPSAAPFPARLNAGGRVRGAGLGTTPAGSSAARKRGVETPAPGGAEAFEMAQHDACSQHQARVAVDGAHDPAHVGRLELGHVGQGQALELAEP